MTKMEFSSLLIVPGLNNKTEIWTGEGSFIRNHYAFQSVHLKGHNPGEIPSTKISATHWKHDILNALKSIDKERVIGVGYSLGGLLLLDAMLQQPGRFERLVLFAPAVYIRNYVQTLSLIPEQTDICISSYAPKDVRVHPKIHVSYYKALFSIARTVRKKLDTIQKFPVPVTVIMSPKDEVLLFRKTASVFQKKGASIVSVKQKKRKISDYAHLITLKKYLNNTDVNIIENQLNAEFRNVPALKPDML
jgi:esterase/lipase